MSRRATPAIAMEPQFHGNYECELNDVDYRIYQYHGVKAGTADFQVTAMDSGDAQNSGTITFQGVAQEDALENESVKVVMFGPTWAFNTGGVARDARLECIYNADATLNGWFITLNPATDWMDLMIHGYALETAPDLAKFKIFITREIAAHTS